MARSISPIASGPGTTHTIEIEVTKYTCRKLKQGIALVVCFMHVPSSFDEGFFFEHNCAACMQLDQMVLQIWRLAVTGQHHRQGQHCRGASPACTVSFLLSF